MRANTLPCLMKHSSDLTVKPSTVVGAKTLNHFMNYVCPKTAVVHPNDLFVHLEVLASCAFSVSSQLKAYQRSQDD